MSERTKEHKRKHYLSKSSHGKPKHRRRHFDCSRSREMEELLSNRVKKEPPQVVEPPKEDPFWAAMFVPLLACMRKGWTKGR